MKFRAFLFIAINGKQSGRLLRNILLENSYGGLIDFAGELCYVLCKV
jgi:hypothetical protein